MSSSGARPVQAHMLVEESLCTACLQLGTEEANRRRVVTSCTQAEHTVPRWGWGRVNDVAEAACLVGTNYSQFVLLKATT